MADRHDHIEEHPIRPHEPLRGQLRYEVRDVNAWAVGRFGIALILLCIFSIALLFGLFRYFESIYGGPLPDFSLNEDARTLPPEPTLQRTPVLDLQRFRAAEDQVLNSYSWVDREHGIVHVPIDVAIDILAKRGLPSRQQAPVLDSVSVPTDSGLGPIMQRPGGPLAPELSASAAASSAPSPSQSPKGVGQAAPAEEK